MKEPRISVTPAVEADRFFLPFSQLEIKINWIVVFHYPAMFHRQASFDKASCFFTFCTISPKLMMIQINSIKKQIMKEPRIFITALSHQQLKLLLTMKLIHFFCPFSQIEIKINRIVDQFLPYYFPQTS